MASLKKTIFAAENHTKWALVGFILSVALFLFFPELDLKIAAHYYNGEFFYLEENPYATFVYWFFGNIHLIFLILFLYFTLHAFFKDQHRRKKKWAYLFVCLVMGPGLLVSVLLQDHSYGRPRPVQLKVFGGAETYSAPFEYSEACARNCSFVSARAAIGFFILSIAWVRHNMIWIVFGIILGSTVGFVRMIQGAHFLSDIVFAFWAVWFTSEVIARVFGFTIRTHSTESKNSS